MTKKDFEAVAAIMLHAIDCNMDAAEVARTLCVDFAYRYERFDRARFLRACEVGQS